MSGDRPIDRVLMRLESYQERYGKFRSRCPAHQGNSDNSLSVEEGEDGRVLIKCHADCELQEVLDALELNASDLFHQNGHDPLQDVKIKPPRKEKILTTDQLPKGRHFDFTSPAGKVIYRQHHKGAYYRKVGEDHWKAKLDGISQILYGLPELMEGVKAGKTIYHLEGPKDVETARDRLGVVATTSGGTSSWKPEFKGFYTGADVVIVPDNDKPGHEHAEEVAGSISDVAGSVKILHLPDLPESKDLTDWLEAGRTKEEFFALVEEAKAYEQDEEGSWPEPKPVEVKLPDVAELDPTIVPGPLRGWVKDAAERMDNAPPDFAAAATIVSAASLLGRKVGIRPKRKDDWMVIPNLWGGLVGPPASMKTPSLEQAIKPVKRLATEAQKEHEEALEEHKLDAMIVEANKRALNKKLDDTAKKVAASGASRGDLEDIREEIKNIEEPEEPNERRFMTNDATIEKLAEILEDNPKGILYYRDELMGWLRSLDKPGRESDRAFYLEAWNGNGSFSVDRIGRGSLHVPAVCVSVLGGIQPGPLKTYVTDALEEAEKADGLLQRFQVLVYPDIRGYEPVDRWPDTEAKNRAYRVLDGLANIDVEAFGVTFEDEEDVPYVRFDTEAQEVFDAWRAEFEPRFREEEYPAAVQSHFMKYRSLFASLALVFEAIEYVHDGKARSGVGKESALRAAAWCEYLESHAMRVYAPAMDTTTLIAKALLDRIEVGDVEHGVKVREIYRSQWSGLTTVEEVTRAIEVLEEHGWVRRVKVKPKGGGRPSEVLHVHPEIRD